MNFISETYYKECFRISENMYYYVVNSGKINDGHSPHELLNLLSGEEQKRYARYRKEETKKAFLCARIILREEFRKLKIPFDMEINFNKYNKPFLSDYPDFHFNISHSGNYVMLGFSRYPLGVDIERIVTYNKSTIMKLAKIVFHKTEVQLLLQQIENEAQFLFTKLWSIKESFIKAIGKGFYADTKSFTINNINSRVPYVNIEAYKNISLYSGMYNDEMAVSVSGKDVIPKTYQNGQ